MKKKETNSAQSVLLAAAPHSIPHLPRVQVRTSIGLANVFDLSTVFVSCWLLKWYFSLRGSEEQRAIIGSRVRP